MKLFYITAIIGTIVFSVQESLSQDYGFNHTTREYAIYATEIYYEHYTDRPNMATAFYFVIQNNTSYSFTEMDVDISLFDGKKLFFKKYVRLKVDGWCNPGDVVTTSKWYLDPPIASRYFTSKKLRWVTSVKVLYTP